MKRDKLLLALSIGLFSFIISVTRLNARTDGGGALIQGHLRASSPHAPVIINGNSELGAYPGITGNGTLGNPYIIADWDIDAGSSGPCIEIRNTDMYVTITNCTVTNSVSNYSVIKVVNGSNVNILGNNVTGNYGIYLNSSNNNTISGNNVTNSYYKGICLSSSSNNTISGNNVTYSYNEGIFLAYSSNYNTISGNNLVDNGWMGIHLHYSNNNLLSGNNVVDNDWRGIYLASSSNNNISGNNVSGNDDDGVHVEYHSNYNTFSRNNVTGNSWNGFYLGSSSNGNVILNNTIFNNALACIYMSFDSQDNNINSNDMVDGCIEIEEGSVPQGLSIKDVVIPVLFIITEFVAFSIILLKKKKSKKQ